MFLGYSVCVCVCVVGYVGYFIAACVLDFKRATALIVLTSLAVVAKSYDVLKEYKGESISRCFKPAVRCFRSNLKWLKWSVFRCVFLRELHIIESVSELCWVLLCF